MKRNMKRAIAMLLVLMMSINTPLSTVVAQETSDDSVVEVVEEVTDETDEDVTDETESEVEDEAGNAVTDEVDTDENSSTEDEEAAVPMAMSLDSDEDAAVASISEVDESDWEYVIQNYEIDEVIETGVYISSYVGEDKETVVVPESLGGHEVRVIGNNAFYNYSSIETVVYPDSVISIYDLVNESTTITVQITEASEALSRGEINNQFVVENDENPFVYQYLPYVKGVYDSESGDWFGEWVEDYLAIVGYTDKNVNTLTVSSVEVGTEQVVGVGENAFYDCNNLEAVTLGDEIKYVGQCALPDGVYFEVNKTSEAIENQYLLSDFTIANDDADNLIYIFKEKYEYKEEYNAWYGTYQHYLSVGGCEDKAVESITISDKLGDIPIEGIENNAFIDCEDLEWVKIPDSIWEIGGSSLPSNAYYIITTSSQAFLDKRMGDDLFSFQEDMYLYTFLYDENGDVTGTVEESYLAVAGYKDKTVRSLDIKGSVGDFVIQGIAQASFDDFENLEYVTIGNDIAYIGEWSIPYSTYYIIDEGSKAFQNKSLYSYFMFEGEDFKYEFINTYKYTQDEWGNQIQEVDETYLQISGYMDTSATTIKIPAYAGGTSEEDGGIAVTRIGWSAFYDCYNVESIELPDKIEYVEWDSISEDVYYTITENSAAFQNQELYARFIIENDYCIYCFDANYDSFVDDDGNWQESVTNYLKIVGYSDTTATTIEIPAYAGGTSEEDGGIAVTVLDSFAFEECYDVEYVVLPDSIITIGWWTLPDNAYYVITENSLAFQNKSLYTKFKLAEDSFIYQLDAYEGEEYNEETGEWDWVSTYFLRVVGCTDTTATTITIEDEVSGIPVEAIDWGAFYDCTSLETLILSENIVRMESNIFGSNTTAAIQLESMSDPLFDIVVSSGNKYKFADGTKASDFTYEMIGSDLYITGYIGDDADTATTIVIDESIYGIPVYGIIDGAFEWGYDNLECIKVPDSVEYIGEWNNNGGDAYIAIDSTDSKAFQANKICTQFRIGDSSLYAWTYNYYTGSYEFTLISYTEEMNGTTLEVPTTFEGKSVTSFYMTAFSGYDGATTVIIPSEITYIPDTAYWSYISDDLEAFEVESGNENYYSDENGSLYQNNGDGTTTLIALLEDSVSINVDETVTSIAYMAFSSSNTVTESLNIPSAVSNIDVTAFASGYSKLKSIEVSTDSTTYASSGGVLYNKDFTTLYAIPNAITSVTMPETVTVLEDNQWSAKSELTELYISKDLGQIDVDLTGFNSDYWTDEDDVKHYYYWLEVHGDDCDGTDCWGDCDGYEYYWYNGDDLTYSPLEDVEELGLAPSLETISVSEDNEFYACENGVLYSKDMTTIYAVPMAKTGSYEVPSTVTTIISMIMCSDLDITVAEGNTHFEMIDGVLVETATGDIYSYGSSLDNTLTVSESEVTYGETFTVTLTADENTPSTVGLYIGNELVEEKSGITSGDEVIFTVDTSKKELSADVFTGTVSAVTIKGDSAIAAGSVILNKKGLDLAVDTTITREYDGTGNFDDDVELAVTGILEGDDVGDVVTAILNTLDRNVGTNKEYQLTEIALTGDDKDYYEIASVDSEIDVTITTKALTITAEDISVKQGSTDYELTYSVDGLVEIDSIDNVTFDTSDIDTSTKGDYTISIESVNLYTIVMTSANDNYDITYVDGTLTVEYTTAHVTEDIQSVVETLPESTDDGYTDAVNEAAANVIASIEKAGTDETTGAQEATKDADLVALVNELDAAFVEANENLTVEPVAPATADDADISGDLLLPAKEVEVQGLAIATYGSEEVEVKETTVLSIQVTQMESTDDELSVSIEPMKTTGTGDGAVTTKIENEEISAPITFKMYVNDNNTVGDYIYIKHIFDDTEPSVYEVIRAEIQKDEVGKYVMLTVSHFSTFTMEAYMPGDVDKNSSVGLKDATSVMKYIAEWEDLDIKEVALDTNGDNSVGLKDATRIMQYIVGEDVILY